MSHSAHYDRVFLFAGFRLDPRRRLLQRADGEHVPLTGRAFDTLLFLVEHPNELVDKRDLIDAVWPGLAVEDNNLNQNISILRRTLGEAPGEHRFIVTVPGRGFRFVPAVTQSAAAAQPDRSAQVKEAEIPVASATPNSAVAMEAQSFSAAPTHSVASEGAESPSQPRSRWSQGLSLASLSIVFLATGATAWWRGHAPVEPVPKPAAVATLPPRTVAVLPFENISGDSHNDYLALGIAEMVLNRLASVRELLVIARTSAFQFQGKNIDAREIGRQLAVRYLVEGSVQREHHRVRVSVQLIDAETGRQFRSLTVDRNLQDLFGLQDEIADKVAAALEVSLAGVQWSGPTPRVVNLDAYFEYLQGKALLDRWRRSSAQEATAHFERAIRIDPTYAPAYAELAMASMQYSQLSWNGTPPPREKVAALLEKALSLDPSLGEAYVLRGELKDQVDLAAAEPDFRHGLALSPNYGAGYAMFALALSERGRDAEALELIDRARLIDPLTARNHYLKGLLVSSAVRYEAPTPPEAEALMLEALRCDPTFSPAFMRLAQWKWRRGETAEALKMVERALRVDADTPWIHFRAAEMYVELHDIASARAVGKLGDLEAAGIDVLLALDEGDWRRAAERAYSAAGPQQDEEFEYQTVLAIRGDALKNGGVARAIRFLRERYRVPERMDLTADLALAELMSKEQGQQAQRRDLVERIAQANREQEATVGPVHQVRAVIAALEGDKESAIAALQQYPLPLDLPNLLTDPVWDAVRSDPRFQSLVARETHRVAQEREHLEALRRNGEIPRHL